MKEQHVKYILYSLPLIICFSAVLLLFYSRKDDSDKNISPAKEYTVKGIDISHHNAFPDWYKLEQDGIHFAYLKATEGSDQQDRNYSINYKGSKDSKIKIGSYHFYTFAESGLSQAQNFIRTANCNSGDLLPAIDVEHNRSNPNSSDTTFIAKVVRELKILENEIYKYYGIHPVIYTDKTCYQLYIKNNFDKNPLWFVDLNTAPSNDVLNWKIWQYSHKGSLNGIEGHVDLNYYRYSISNLKELLLP